MKTENLKIEARALGLRQFFPLVAIRLDATEKSPAVWAAVLGGAGLGLAWGIAARLWMRLISTHPEFSIFGTAAILIIATLFGAFAGLAFAARQRGWRRWGHYVPRILAVIFFIPFGAFGGLPLMLTVLLATLGFTQKAVVNMWFLAGLATLVVTGTDFDVPTLAAGVALTSAIVITLWHWLALRWVDSSKLQRVNAWLDRVVSLMLFALAAFVFWSVARDVLSSQPILLGLFYVFLYLILLYPLFLALRIGLAPAISTGVRS